MNTDKEKAKDGEIKENDMSPSDMAKLTVEAVIHRSEPLDHRQNMIEYFNNCSMCGSELEFTHVTQFQYGEVQMEGHCPCCEVRLKDETHRLQ